MGERENLIKNLNKILVKIKKDFSIKKFILFGSRSGKEFREDSDVDLIIVSKDFNKINFFDRCSKMYDYWDLDYAVDFICYTPEEFEKLRKKITIVSQALKEGIEIK